MVDEKFNPDIFTMDGNQKKSNKSFLYFGIGILILLVLVLGGVFLLKYSTSNTKTASAPDIAEARAFVQDFTLHFYNLSAGYFETERDKTAKYMDNDVLKAYQKNFYDQKLLDKINKHNLATSFDIERLDFVAKGQTEYQFRVIGNVKFTSLKLGTYIQFPFSHTIITAKTETGYRITNFIVD